MSIHSRLNKLEQIAGNVQPGGRVVLVCLPMKLDGSSGAPGVYPSVGRVLKVIFQSDEQGDRIDSWLKSLSPAQVERLLATPGKTADTPSPLSPRFLATRAE